MRRMNFLPAQALRLLRPYLQCLSIIVITVLLPLQFAHAATYSLPLPTPRGLACQPSTLHNGHTIIVLFGGINDNVATDPIYYNDIHMFNVTTNEWRSLSPVNTTNVPIARTKPTCSLQSTNTSLILRIFGGISPSYTFPRDLWSIDLSTMIWRREWLVPNGYGPNTLGLPDAPYTWELAVWYNRSIVVTISVTNSPIVFNKDPAIYWSVVNVDTHTWQHPKTTFQPKYSQDWSSCVSTAGIYYWGGSTIESSTDVSLWYIDMTNLTWSVIPVANNNSLPLRVRSAGMACSIKQNSVYLYGGVNQATSTFNTLWQFNLTNSTWNQITLSPSSSSWPSARGALRYLHWIDAPSSKTSINGSFTDDSLLLMGGYTSSNAVSDLWRFSFTTYIWRDMTVVKEPGLSMATRVALACDWWNELWICSGGRSNQVNTNNIMAYYPLRYEWSSLGVSMSTALYAHSMNIINNMAYFLGGTTSSLKSYPMLDVLDLTTSTWYLRPFGNFSLGWLSQPATKTLTNYNVFLLFGGYDVISQSYPARTWLFNATLAQMILSGEVQVDNNTVFTDISDDSVITPPSRTAASMTVYDNIVYMFGGGSCVGSVCSSRNDLWQWNYHTHQWSSIIPAPGTSIPTARRSTGMTYIGNLLLIQGGSIGTTTTSVAADMWIFDLRNSTWLSILDWTNPQSVLRQSHCITSYNSHVIIIGGSSTSKTLLAYPGYHTIHIDNENGNDAICQYRHEVACRSLSFAVSLYSSSITKALVITHPTHYIIHQSLTLQNTLQLTQPAMIVGEITTATLTATTTGITITCPNITCVNVQYSDITQAVMFKSLTLAQSRTALVAQTATLWIIDCHFMNNTASSDDEYGGAIMVLSSRLGLTNCDFINNTAGVLGGAVYVSNSVLLVQSTIFSRNTIVSNIAIAPLIGGGGIAGVSSTMVITDSQFDCHRHYVPTNQMASQYTYGGAIVTLSSKLVVRYSRFTTSSAGQGGAIAAWGLPLPFDVSSWTTIDSCTFILSQCQASGGAIYARSSTTTITNSSFLHGYSHYGGATAIMSSSLTITNTTYTRNYAEVNGGALYLSGAATTITTSTFIKNSAPSGGGGGIYWRRLLASDTPPVITSLSFTNNTASYGAQMASETISLSIIDGTAHNYSQKSRARLWPAVQIAFVDHYNQIVTTSSSPIYANPASTFIAPPLMSAVNGIATFSDLILAPPPNTTFEIYFSWSSSLYGDIATPMISLQTRQCAPGSYVDSSIDACEVCSEGTYSIQMMASSCISCAIGRYQPLTNSTSCHACAAGQYSTAGASHPITCPSGTYTFQQEIDGSTSDSCSLCQSLNSAARAQLSLVNRLVYDSMCTSVSSSSPTLEGVIYFFATLLVLGSILTMIAFIRSRRHQVVMAASLLFCLILLISLIMIAATSISLVIGASVEVCTVRNWLGHVSYASSFGGLLLKTHRLWRMANTKSLNVVHLPDSVLGAFFAAFVGLPMVYLAIWTSVDPFVLERKVYNGISYDICTTTSSSVWWQVGIMIVEGLLILWGVHLCLATRNAPTQFNESKWIAGCLYAISFVALLCLLIVYTAVNSDPRSTTAIESASFLICGFTLLFGYFGPKLWRLYLIRRIRSTSSSPKPTTPVPIIAGAARAYVAGSGGTPPPAEPVKIPRLILPIDSQPSVSAVTVANGAPHGLAALLPPAATVAPLNGYFTTNANGPHLSVPAALPHSIIPGAAPSSMLSASMTDGRGGSEIPPTGQSFIPSGVRGHHATSHTEFAQLNVNGMPIHEGLPVATLGRTPSFMHSIARQYDDDTSHHTDSSLTVHHDHPGHTLHHHHTDSKHDTPAITASTSSNSAPPSPQPPPISLPLPPVSLPPSVQPFHSSLQHNSNIHNNQHTAGNSIVPVDSVFTSRYLTHSSS